MRNCFSCGYFMKSTKKGAYITGYCNDLDCEVDPYEPSCSDENYNA